MYMCVGAHGSQKKTSGILELIEIKGDYEPPKVGTGSWTVVVWRNRKHS